MEKIIAQSCKYLNFIYLSGKTAEITDYLIYLDQFLAEETSQLSTENILRKTKKKNTKKKKEHGKGTTLSSVTHSLTLT